MRPRRAVRLAALGAASVPAGSPRRSRAADSSFAADRALPSRGTTDTLAPMPAERLGAGLGRTVEVENRGGAAGVIAGELASRAEPASHTLFLAVTGTAAKNPHLHARLSYRPEDLVPVVLLAELPNVLVVRPDAPWRTLGGLPRGSAGAAWQAHPRQLGQRQQPAPFGRDLKADAGVDLLHVPFRGGADTMNQILGGRVDAGMNNLPSVIALIRAGQLRALAATGAVRAAVLPEVPTAAESGLPGYAATAWLGVQAPAWTPPEVIARLNAESTATVADPPARERAQDLGARLLGASPAEFADYMREEGERWAAAIRRSGAKVD